MIKKQEEICQDPECGHDIVYHGTYVEKGKKARIRCLGGGDCTCKKFVAKVSNKPRVSVKTKSKSLKPKKEGTSLSDKRKGINSKYLKKIHANYIYLEEEVKEFIKKETKLIQLWMRDKITAKEFWERRRKLCGKDLR